VRDVVVGSGQKEEQKQVEARERGFERERERGYSEWDRTSSDGVIRSLTSVVRHNDVRHNDVRHT
jgi:hypothetical protein